MPLFPVAGQPAFSADATYSSLDRIPGTRTCLATSVRPSAPFMAWLPRLQAPSEAAADSGDAILSFSESMPGGGTCLGTSVWASAPSMALPPRFQEPCEEASGASAGPKRRGSFNAHATRLRHYKGLPGCYKVTSVSLSAIFRVTLAKNSSTDMVRVWFAPRVRTLTVPDSASLGPTTSM